MENQRLFLVIALVFVLFLIWDAWVKEQAALNPPVPVTTTTVPGATPVPGATAPTVPQLNDVPSALPPTAAPAEPAVASAAQVQVTTDLFIAEINAIGGDLRRVGLRTYPESVDRQEQPFVLLDDTRNRLFIAQSGLISPSGIAPDHYQQYVPEQTAYTLQSGQDSLDVRLTWTHESGLKVTKVYTFHRGSFAVDVKHIVENTSGGEWLGSQYRQLQRIPPVQQQNMMTGVYTYTGGVISTPEKVYEKIDFSDMAEKNIDLAVTGGWIAMIQHYFLAAWIPEQTVQNQFYSKVVGGDRYILGMIGPQQAVAAGATATFASLLYVGPKDQDRLEELAPNLRLTVDYGIFTIIAEPLFWLLKVIHSVIGNWGWAIVILTILIKAVFFKLSEASYRSMAKMRNLAPQLQRLKERYGDDRQKMNQAMMEMYKKEKINPLGGCLPILVQIPVFISLYWMLAESVELRQAPWILWINDLSTKDPYYVLPLIMGASMFVQQKLNPTPPDPIQAKVMMALPLVFTVFFLWFPAGLVLYWVVNNLLSIAQQWVITKRVEEAAKKA